MIQKQLNPQKRKEEELVYNQFLIRDKEFKEKFEKELKKKNNKKNQEIDKIDGINNSISINQKINQNNNQPTSNNSNNLYKKVDKKPNIQKDLLYYFNQTPKNKEIYMKNIQLNLKNKNKGKGKKSISDKLITSVKFKGITLNNKDCKNHTFDTSGYCIKHRNQKKK
ncbi:hypothetical protein M0812_17860 [Anaeramoeba flamelloides]|uniref:Uncharacterized protein n=1 Tax=Anaeramoeba flamelloides TaxID=1746091 RepID=A0AAV7Z4H1_9EUKA|nr:hypothetical protein M0812_17860 [Anaeramoeba flamelloides]